MAESTKALTAEGATVVTTAEGSSATAAPPAEPKTLLVALTTGPTTDPSKCALAFLVASKAAAAGHSVSMFLASDGVQCLTDDVISSLEGVGTGKLSETYPACVAAGVTFYVSGSLPVPTPSRLPMTSSVRHWTPSDARNMETLWPEAAALDATRNASAHLDGSVVGPVVRATSSFLGSAGGAAVALLPSAVVTTVAPSAVNSLVDSAIA